MPVFQIFNRKQVIERLIAARGELDDAMRIGSPAARYDPQVLPRERVLLIVRELEELIRELEEKA